MPKFFLIYSVEKAGWATARLAHEFEVEMTVSYLHDSLGNLAQTAVELTGGATESTVHFLDEPGEHQIRFNRRSPDDVDYEVRWYEDWESWGLVAEDKYKLIGRGVVSVSRLRHQVLNVLNSIYSDLGPKEYKERWIEHEFPTEMFEKLGGTV